MPNRVVYPTLCCLCLVVLPFANFLAGNYSDPSLIPSEFLVFAAMNIAGIFGAMLAASGVIAIVLRRYDLVYARSMTACGALFFLLFSFSTLSDFFNSKGPMTTIAGLHLGMVAAVTAVIWIFAKNALVSIALAAFAAINLVFATPAFVETLSAATADHTQDSTTANNNTTNGLPNIYYVILDAYPSAASLSSTLEFDNSDFLAKMKQRGYFLADEAHSSYNQTFLTLTAIMALDYFSDDLSPKATKDDARKRYPRLLTGETKPHLVAEAHNLGYDFYVVGNYWGKCAGPHVNCYSDEKVNRYVRDVFWSAASLAVLWEAATDFSSIEYAPAIKGKPPKYKMKVSFDAFDVDAIGRVLAKLENEGPAKKSTFTFVHHLSPHPPYLFESNCGLRPEYRVDFKLWSEEAKPYFLANLLCTNSKVLELVAALDKLDPNAIVVFQGDHGSAFTVIWDSAFDQWSSQAILERSGILNLVKLPEPCFNKLHPYIDNVNTAKAVMNCVGSGSQPEEVRSFVSTYSSLSSDARTLREVDPRSNKLLPVE